MTTDCKLDGKPQRYHLRQVEADEKVKGYYRGAEKSLAWPGRKQATVTEDFDVHISYL